MRRLLLFLILSMLILGCSKPRTIDSSTEESFKTSIETIKSTLGNDEKEEFEEALAAVLLSGISKILDPNFNPDDTFSAARESLNGKTAEEVIAQGKIVIAERKAKQLEQLRYEFKEVKEKIAELETSKLKANQDKEELKNFRVTRSRFYFNENDFMTEPVIEMTVINDTEHPISKVHFHGVLATPGRSVPWVAEDFNYKISGGLEPGEKVTWHLAPNMLSEWWKAPKDRQDMVLTVATTRIDGPDGEPVYNSEFSEFDETRLADLKSRLAKIKENLAELSTP